MFKNHFITAIRNLTRNKRYSFIIILCLTVGLTACLLVATVVINDLSYDRQWTKSKDIYRILMVPQQEKGGKAFAQSYTGLGPTLQQQFPEVENYCRMGAYPTTFRLGNGSDGVKINCLQGDTTLWNFLNLNIVSGNPKHLILGLNLEKGRWLNPALPTDAINQDSLMNLGMDKLTAVSKMQPILITAYTAKALGIKKLNKPAGIILGIPVGIIQNFNSESLLESLKPCVITAETDPQYGNMLIRVFPGSEQTVQQEIYKLWQQFYPDRILHLDWISDILAKQYSSEKKLSQLFTLFSSLSIFLACLGLFGLIAFTAERRTKEIGIRKVLGATVNGIVALLSKEFLVLVLIGFVIASPIAWWIMNKWLQNFAYRIHISWWIFAIAGALAVFIALITVSFQAIKAAMANPVESLRTE